MQYFRKQGIKEEPLLWHPHKLQNVKKPNKMAMLQIDESTTLNCKKRKRHNDAAPKEPPQKKRRSPAVRFNTTVKITQFHSTDMDMQNAWYCPQEYRKFIVDCAKTMRTLKMLNGDLEKLEGNNTCIRGLEFQYEKEMGAKKKQRRQNLIATVLAQQKENQLAGNKDSSNLRIISETLSEDSKAIGLVLAALDLNSRLQCWVHNSNVDANL